MPAPTQFYAPIEDFVQSHFYEDKLACLYTSKIPHKPSAYSISSHAQAILPMTNKLFAIAFALNLARQKAW
jgi:hypothetical protein